MKFLVTGGAGFLGSHLCDYLLHQGHHVVAVDNLSTGSLQNIESALENQNFEFLKHDINLVLDLEIDGIFNLACPASPKAYQSDPIGTFYTCVFGSNNLLRLASKLNVRILQASTSEVYGDPQKSPQSEAYWGNVNPVGIRSCYDEGKRAAETLFNDFYLHNATDIQIARIFNTYGPRMAVNDGRVVSNFIVQALLGTDITIYGDGSQIRSLCFVSDLVRGLVDLFFAKSYLGPVNLGNPQPISMLSLANEIIKLTGTSSKIIFSDLPKDDPITRKPDITKAVENLKWSPIVSRFNGLRETVEYFSKVLFSRET
jgi:UDP-glucuronate decarboxylase